MPFSRDAMLDISNISGASDLFVSYPGNSYHVCLYQSQSYIGLLLNYHYISDEIIVLLYI